ncbi:MAG: hypothetical protein DMG65_23355 [Candidatus Angelobacter sp. Gp1-AA117]|nr:MAG: hypothetical protein DMG65_23355 [Candidatus Angelobacter sp. Gp1-AA117]
MSLLVAIFALAAMAAPADKMAAVGDVAQHAVEQSQLTLPGSAPFHLKAAITETTNPESQYSAEVEEYWISPEKWRRSIHSPEFSQTLIVNGDRISEQDSGDYYPFWLHDLVTALFDPLPMAQQLRAFRAQIQLPGDSPRSTSCMNSQTHSGTPPAQSTLPLVFCFQGKNGLLKSVTTPGYNALFSGFQPFKNKQVPRQVTINPQPGTTIVAKITQLEQISSPDEALFTVAQPTPAAQQIKSVELSEDLARRIAKNTPEIVWPAVRAGKTSGVLAVYISVDRSGHVQEVWPLNSDNPALNDAARRQVSQWQFQPYVNGVPMQMQSVLTFAFTTRIDNPYPLLDNAQARKLAIHNDHVL